MELLEGEDEHVSHRGNYCSSALQFAFILIVEFRLWETSFDSS